MAEETKKINQKLILIGSIVAAAVVVAIIALVLILNSEGVQKSSYLEQAQEEFAEAYELDMKDGKLDEKANTKNGYYVEKILGELIAKYDKTFKEKFVITFDGEEWKITLVGEEVEKPVQPTPASKFGYEVQGNGVVITEFKDKTVTEVVVPAEIDGLPVVGIKEGTFSECSALANITAEEDSMFIGFEGNLYTKDGGKLVCFAPANKATEFTVPEFVTSIDAYAFAGNANLTSVKVPANVKELGAYAFYGCEKLEKVELPEGLTAIKEGAFSECAVLKSANIPSTVTVIEARAFSGCAKLAELALPQNIAELGDYAFNGCKTFTALEVPASLEKLGFAVFGGCTAVTKLTITNIGEDTAVDSIWALFGEGEFPAGLTTVVVAEGATKIGNGAFWSCDQLTTVELPSTLKVIGDKAFIECDGLTAIKLPNGLEEIGEDAFFYCDSLTTLTIPGSVKVIGAEAFRCCVGLTTIIIEEGVEEIGDYAFRCCDSVTEITIPSSVKVIGEGIFKYNTALKTINLPCFGEGTIIPSLTYLFKYDLYVPKDLKVNVK